MTSATLIREPTIPIEEVRKVLPMQIRNQPAFGAVILQELELARAATPRELARRTGISELIVRSVLEALTCVDSAEFDAGTGRYSPRRNRGGLT